MATRHSKVGWVRPSSYSFRHTVLGLALCLDFQVQVDARDSSSMLMDIYDTRADVAALAHVACTHTAFKHRLSCRQHVRTGARNLICKLSEQRMGELRIRGEWGEWAPPACGTARHRREKQCLRSGSSGPRVLTLPLDLQATTAECKELPNLATAETLAACLVSNFYLLDGVWYFVTNDEHSPHVNWVQAVAAAVRKPYKDNAKRRAKLPLQVISKSKLLLQLQANRQCFTNITCPPGGVQMGYHNKMRRMFADELIVFISQVGIGDGHGHMLHDMALPVYWALDLFYGGDGDMRGLKQHAFEVMFAHYDATPYDEWLALVSPKPPQFVDDVDCVFCPPRSLCHVPIALMGISQELGYFGSALGSARSRDGELLSQRAPAYASFGDFVRRRLFPGQPAFIARGTDRFAVRRGGHVWKSRRQRANYHVIFLQRQHSRVVPNLADLESDLRLHLRSIAKNAGFRPPVITFSTALTDAMSLKEQALLYHEATVVFAVEGGALDNILISPKNLAVVVLGRDPALYFPEGCAISETSHDDPFTHRPLFRALRRHLCGVGYVPGGGGGGFDAASVSCALREVIQLSTQQSNPCHHCS